MWSDWDWRVKHLQHFIIQTTQQATHNPIVIDRLCAFNVATKKAFHHINALTLNTIANNTFVPSFWPGIIDDFKRLISGIRITSHAVSFTHFCARSILTVCNLSRISTSISIAICFQFVVFINWFFISFFWRSVFSVLFIYWNAFAGFFALTFCLLMSIEFFYRNKSDRLEPINWRFNSSLAWKITFVMRCWRFFLCASFSEITMNWVWKRNETFYRRMKLYFFSLYQDKVKVLATRFFFCSRSSVQNSI